MKEIKKVYMLLIVFIGSIAYSQENVGINTNNPQQTLDIEGTLRIATPGGHNKNSIPLAWRPLGGDREGMLVEGANKDYYPFRIVNYKFDLTHPSEDWLDGADLQIPTDKYTVMLMDYALLDDRGYPVFLRLLSSTDGTNTKRVYTGYGDNRGRAYYSTHPKEEDNHGYMTTLKDSYLVSGAPLIMTYPYNNSWRIYADYPGTPPAAYRYEISSGVTKVVKDPGTPAVDKNRTYTWDITFLVVDNAYLHKLPERTIKLNANSDTGRNSVDTITGKQR